MDLTRLLAVGQTVRTGNVTAKVDLVSVSDYERKYRLRFEDGSSRWVNQTLVRHLILQN